MWHHLPSIVAGVGPLLSMILDIGLSSIRSKHASCSDQPSGVRVARCCKMLFGTSVVRVVDVVCQWVGGERRWLPTGGPES